MKIYKLYVSLLITLLISLSSCEDLAFGDKFLQKPPSTDITIDTIFSTADYARRVLWNSYDCLPYGYPINGYRTAMKKGTIEALGDLAHTFINDTGECLIYYPGKYTPEVENELWGGGMTNISKYRFYEYSTWIGIRHAWIFCENVDKVSDMSEEEKSRLKAEAKILVAIFYANMFRHYGGVPIVDHALQADDPQFPPRATLQETLDFTIKLLDEAIACPELPWVLPDSEMDNMYGRVTKASAMGLKVRLLLFAASPLFNDNKPFMPGAASDQKMTWFGDYQQSRWETAAKAGQDFFKAVRSNGYYRLVQADDTENRTYRNAFRDAYYKRGTTESLIATFKNFRTTDQNSLLIQSIRWGGSLPTKELFDLFQMADGSVFSWDNPNQAKNPFLNRDPRLYETIYIDGDDFKGKPIELFQNDPSDPENYPKGKNFGVNPMSTNSMNTGITTFKFGLDRDGGGEFKGRVIQWPLLRMAEIYLSYAEALNELGRATVKDELGMDAFDYVNVLRARVGMQGLPKTLSKEELREAILRERACEFWGEEVRFFDLIRWKREDVFSEHLHGLKVFRHKTTHEYKFEVFQLPERAWQREFSPKFYLSAFPSDEVNKEYGLVQNPGWE